VANKLINAINTCVFFMEPLKRSDFDFSLLTSLCVIGPGSGCLTAEDTWDIQYQVVTLLLPSWKRRMGCMDYGVLNIVV
jgi:hypothetical protein